ncbi:hypothetical protein ACLB1E_01930 [Escherichia coli]
MILANISAARFVEKAKEPALFRIHDKPSTEAITSSVQCWQSWGWNCRAVTSRNRATTRSCWSRLPTVLMQKCCEPCCCAR